MLSDSRMETPQRPRLVLRVGFAGRRHLSPDDVTRVAGSLPDVLSALAHMLPGLRPGEFGAAEPQVKVATFFAKEAPLLRLVTGLCEGADALACRVLETVSAHPPAGGPAGHAAALACAIELAAVLPCDIEAYRRSRPAEFLPEFDRQLARCAWVLTLDGIVENPCPTNPLAENRRARAYRAQAAFILRHSDILIAVADPDDPGKAGGTLETVREALAFELPVIFIHSGTGAVSLIAPEDDLHSALAHPTSSPVDWRAQLREWVSQIIADPDHRDNGEPNDREVALRRSHKLLQEFFDHGDSPSRDSARWGIRLRKWAWDAFEMRFRSSPALGSVPVLPPFNAYRDRAVALAYHYSSLYRGAFLLNYLLAIVAVVLAAASLVLLGTASHTPVSEPITQLLQVAGHLTGTVNTVSVSPRPWLFPVLLTLGMLKLGLVIFISRNTRLANTQEWNDRAVDYRYLAERLRGMYYLPLAGSHQPPAASPPQFASRVVRQSAVDWLFEAIVRSTSPANLPYATSLPPQVKTLLLPNSLSAVEKVRDAWIGEQAKYHDLNARTMHNLHHVFEKVASCLGRTVIAVVGVDLLLVGGEVFHLLPQSWQAVVKSTAPWLIFVSAVLPAIVAALGGIRFQSECERLAERSAVMRAMLRGRSLQGAGGRWALADALARRIAVAKITPATDPGSWNYDALRLTEKVATDFVQETAEWSVLYSKEVSDPG